MRLSFCAAVMAALLGGCRRPPESVPAAAPPSTPPPPASPASAPAASAILAGKPLYSQHNEELVVRDFFQDRRDGVFLDVGCASPIDDNNTYYLEKHLGWSGLAVDALPEFAQPWERKRPRSRFFNFYVSDHAGTVEPFYRSALRGVSSGRKDQKGPGGKQVPLQEIQVPTTTLNKLLDTNGVTRLDFLSMDIEGHEPAALAGFDIKRFRPALACVETKPANRDTITRYFAANGYERLDRYLEHDTVNWYFAPRASPN